MFAVDLVSSFSKVSLVLVGHEWETVEQVAEVGKAFLHDRAFKWLRSRSDVPMLVSTSSDGTHQSHSRNGVRSAREV